MCIVCKQHASVHTFTNIASKSLSVGTKGRRQNASEHSA